MQETVFWLRTYCPLTAHPSVCSCPLAQHQSFPAAPDTEAAEAHSVGKGPRATSPGQAANQNSKTKGQLHEG